MAPDTTGHELTAEELAAESASDLPDREAMSIIGVDLGMVGEGVAEPGFALGGGGPVVPVDHPPGETPPLPVGPTPPGSPEPLPPATDPVPYVPPGGEASLR